MLPPLTTGSTRCRSLTVVLIRPSKYDDEGYVIRHLRGVLPSNTLACIFSLTEDLRLRSALGRDLEIRTRIFDDSVQSIPAGKIIRSNRLPGNRTVVALVGVQSNQFPRAADLARRFRAAGLQVLIGGFHVSGILALFSEVRPEIRELMDLGVTVVKGEVEDAWGEILMDALHDRLRPLYDLLAKKPDLACQPVPMISRAYLKRFVAAHFGTLDCGRGCPFNCSFCTIINVQGHRVRSRSVEMMTPALRENYRRNGVNYYFFTDDDFARNPCWREVFEMLERLRSHEGLSIQFMIQVDMQAYKIPGFVDLAARAGCTQVFIGVESINPQNLKLAGKAQNRVQEYREMIAAWHQAKVATHIAYIIGFPFDTPRSVEEDVERLKRELGVEQVSFFMWTPLPGSRDHAQMVRNGEYLDPDLNRYDSAHETILHPNFAAGEWYSVYRKAWRDFYTFDYMRDVLAKAHAENYWNIFFKFLWYRNSVEIEGGHPMIHGFVRLKDRVDRRPGTRVESRFRHLRRRWGDFRRLARQSLELALEMEELWLQTRRRSRAELCVMAELERLRGELRRNLRTAELRLAYCRAKARVPELHVPSRLALTFRGFSLGFAGRVTGSRAELEAFWRFTRECWSRRRILLIRPHRVFLNFVRDVRLILLFACALRSEDPELSDGASLVSGLALSRGRQSRDSV